MMQVKASYDYYYSCICISFVKFKYNFFLTEMSTDMTNFVRHMLTDFASRQKGNLDEWNEKAVKYYLDLSQKFADNSYSEG